MNLKSKLFVVDSCNNCHLIKHDEDEQRSVCQLDNFIVYEWHDDDMLAMNTMRCPEWKAQQADAPTVPELTAEHIAQLMRLEEDPMSGIYYSGIPPLKELREYGYIVKFDSVNLGRMVKLTDTGRAALEAYRASMEEVE